MSTFSNVPPIPPAPAKGEPAGEGAPQPIVIHQRIDARPPRRLRSWIFYFVLTTSLFANVALYTAYEEYFADSAGPTEHYHSGDKLASKSKIARIHIGGTIMPPFTNRILKSIKQAQEDDAVKGVLLVINSPGGLVSDSHQIYHRLVELREKKPIFVSMESLAASGGYYIAMGAGEKGKIFAEPTTWTGSIGVIIPRYDVSELAGKLGVKSDPLKTGPFKDALSPFRPLTPEERAVWDNILNQAFEEFLLVIDTNRPKLDMEQVKKLATGQIYTAKDALKNGLIDQIGYEEDALRELKKQAGIENARVVEYHFPVAFLDMLLGSADLREPGAHMRTFLEATIPRAMYYFSWAPAISVQ